MFALNIFPFEGNNGLKRGRTALGLANLRIEKSERAGLSIVSKMQTQSFTTILAAVEKLPHPISAIEGLSEEERASVIEALNFMARIQSYYEVPTDKFVSDVCDALREHNELHPSEELQFRERLLKLLNVEALTLVNKADVLRSEHPYTFCAARILTDIRPVFGKDVCVVPPALVLTHTLKIEYHAELGDHREFFISLRSGDIELLREVLDRAELKIRSLETMLKSLPAKLITED